MVSPEQVLDALSALESSISTHLESHGSSSDSWRSTASRFRQALQRLILGQRSQEELEAQLCTLRRINTRVKLGQKEVALTMMQVFISDAKQQEVHTIVTSAPVKNAKRA